MRVLLIYPRFNYPNAGGVQEPLGLLYIAGVLDKAGHEVKLLDLSFCDSIPYLSHELRGVGMVGISSSTALFGRALETMKAIRAVDSNIPIVLGGPHATALPEQSLEAGFDFALIGEGEISAPALVEAIENKSSPESVPGIFCKLHGMIHSTPQGQFVENLDTLPFPDRSRISYDRYFKAGLKQAGVVAMRGCPYRCSYCKPMQDKLFGKRIRTRSAQNVAQELDYIARNIVDRVLFRDDAFTTLKPDWFAELKRSLDEMRTPLWGWVCQGRVDQITGELLDAMQSAGLKMIAFGVESGSQRILDYYRKGITVAQTEKAFGLCRERGVGTHAFIMLGAPIETMGDVEATLRLIEKIKPNSVSPSVTTPAPGTALYEMAVNEGIYNISDWAQSDYMSNKRPMKLEHLSIEQIIAAKEKIASLAIGYGE